MILRWLRNHLNRSTIVRNRGRFSRQRGQVLVLFALASIPIMGFVGLSVDGGNILAHRRMAQNGADAGTLAGLRDFARGEPTTAISSADSYARQSAGTGNGIAVTVQADLVDNSGAAVSPGSATGVQVTLTKSFPTYFITVLGIQNFTVSATARGKVQAYAGGFGAPFLVCSDGLLRSEETLPGGIITDYTTNPPTINPLAYYNSSLNYPEFLLHTSKVGQRDGDCGWENSDQFKGNTPPGTTKAECTTTFSFTAGCWFPYDNGTNAGPTKVRVAGMEGCSASNEAGLSNGCVAFLPLIARQGTPEANCGGSQPTLNMCVKAWLPFVIREGNGPSVGDPSGCAGSNCHIGRLLQGAVATEGTGIDCPAPCTAPVKLIRLTS